MSSQITNSESQLLNASASEKSKMGSTYIHKPTNRKLLRSASLERLKNFNTYICSQNYYILPALLAWLKAPHSKLHASLERLIAILKFIIFTTFLPKLTYKLLRISLHVCTACVRNEIIPQIRSFLESVFLMRLAVYAALTSVFLQLGICLYYLSGVILPSGFLFMCTCLYVITQINYKCLQFIIREPSEEKNNGHKVQKRLSRRDILGERTISNMNLL